MNPKALVECPCGAATWAYCAPGDFERYEAHADYRAGSDVPCVWSDQEVR